MVKNQVLPGKMLDAYNKGVNDINKATQLYNNNNNNLNQVRKEALKNWNDGGSNFIDNHTPRYK